MNHYYFKSNLPKTEVKSWKHLFFVFLSRSLCCYVLMMSTCLCGCHPVWAGTPPNPPAITLTTHKPLPGPAPFPGVQGPLYSLHPVSHTHNLEFSPPAHKEALEASQSAAHFPNTFPLSAKPTASFCLALFLSRSLSFCLARSLSVSLALFLSRSLSFCG